METPKEWLQSNPGGTMNQYYSYLRKKGGVSSHPVSVSTSHNFSLHNKQNEPLYQSMIVGIIFCAVGIVGYFTPWFSIPILNISITGNGLSQIIQFLPESKNDGLKILFLEYAIAIPISYAAIIFGCVMRSYALCILSGILNIIFVGFVVGNFISRIPELFSIGIYLNMFSFFGILFFLFTLKFSGHSSTS